MTTTLSSKGQVVLPRLARARLHLQAGSKLICEVHGDTIVLKPKNPKLAEREYVIDADSGLRVVKKTAQVQIVTSEMVKSIMADFP
jgi:AbrB family looped-hinge helix DNA binding protein